MTIYNEYVVLQFGEDGRQTKFYKTPIIPDVGEKVSYWTNLKDEVGTEEMKERVRGIVKSRDFLFEENVGGINPYQRVFVTLKLTPPKEG